MTDRNKVVWSEGLVPSPPASAAAGPHTDALVRQTLDALPLQNFGFRALELDRTALDAGQIALPPPKACCRTGRSSPCPPTAPAPEPVPVAAGTASGLVRLALPSGGAGRGRDGSGPCRAFGRALPRPLGGGARHHPRRRRAEEIEVAALAPRLLLPGGRTAGFTALADRADRRAHGGGRRSL